MTSNSTLEILVILQWKRICAYMTDIQSHRHTHMYSHYIDSLQNNLKKKFFCTSCIQNELYDITTTSYFNSCNINTLYFYLTEMPITHKNRVKLISKMLYCEAHFVWVSLRRYLQTQTALLSSSVFVTSWHFTHTFP